MGAVTWTQPVQTDCETGERQTRYLALTRAACWSPGLQSCTNAVITKTQRSSSCYRDTPPSQVWTFYFHRNRSGGRICCLMHLDILEVLPDNTTQAFAGFDIMLASSRPNASANVMLQLQVKWGSQTIWGFFLGGTTLLSFQETFKLLLLSRTFRKTTEFCWC